MSYLALKLVHVSCVTLSISLFLLRGAWMLWRPERLQLRWVRVVPHLIDSTLLGSAILLALVTHQYPGVHGWLTAKIVALLVYIGLGTVAIKRGKTLRIRFAAWLAAILVFAYIVAVALNRNPFPLAWLGG